MTDQYYADTACFTGHRRIRSDAVPEIRASLREAVSAAYEQGYRSFLCGGALGFDTLAAQEVLSLRPEYPEIRLTLVLPCADQARYWSRKDQQQHSLLMQQADQVLILRERYDPGCMQNRNRYMVDHASLCICLLTQFSGGTMNTVRYAVQQGLTVWNLAVPAEARQSLPLKESVWNYMPISPSASENADTATFRLIPAGKTAWKDISAHSWKKRG